MKRFYHLDLFSGVGGFSYAAKVVWGDEYRNVGFCEIDPFCQAVLRKNFPDCQIFEDIRTLADTRSKEQQRVSGSSRKAIPETWNDYIDLITGGFPCQGFSMAGRRRGTEDNRYLWPEMFAVIRRFQPSWVIAENVSGLISWGQGVVLEQVCSDMESEGYEVQPFVIPAVSVNAPHRRDRIWFVANRPGDRRQRGGQTVKAQKGHETQSRDARQLAGRSERPYSPPDWNRDWKEVALERCLYDVDDGFSRGLVQLPSGTTITQAKLRREGLKAMGNAIVPQIAIQIMEAIKYVNEQV